MQKKISYYNWSKEVQQGKGGVKLRVGDDLVVTDGYSQTYNLNEIFNEPFKVDMTIALIYRKGEASVSINMKKYRVKAPCMVIILEGQILQRQSEPGDEMPLSISLSRHFLTEMQSVSPNLRNHWNDVVNNPVIQLDENILERIDVFLEQLSYVASDEENPYRMTAIKHFNLAFFWSYFYRIHESQNTKKLSRQDRLVEDFTNLLTKNYKKERSVAFYADQLCITPKYLSTVVKSKTGRTVNDWVDDYVITEGKALLVSSSKSVEEIGFDLNFDSIQLFSKYFHRVTGMSPSAYRKKHLSAGCET